MTGRLTLTVGAIALLSLACGDDDNPTSTMTTAGNGGDGGAGGNGQGAGGATTTTSTSAGGSSNGGNGGNGGNGAGGGPAGGSGPYSVCDNPPANYPAGPYGNELGDTFEPLELSGWTNPSPTQRIDNETFGTFGIADIRTAQPNSFVVLHLSGMF